MCAQITNLNAALWERQKRLIYSGGFLPYCQKYCRENYLALAAHQAFMIDKLESAMTKPNSRLIIKMPPGHAKSTYSSILAPTYFLGRFPKKNIIMTTHTQEFSDRWGRKCRGLIQEPSYSYIFDTGLSKESSAASRFDLENGSSYFGSGILGNFTGLRGDLIIGDDWYRGIEDADSEVIRQKIWDAWIWDLRTRLKPGGSIILIGTPWHEDDHFGRIMISKDKDRWDIIELPALAIENDPLGRDKGTPLWPEYITLEMLTDIRDSLGKKDMRMWNSLYQVSPTNESGDYFQKEWEQYVSHVPPNLNYYGASDYAVTDGRGDYTVHAIIGHDTKNDDIYVIHIWRQQAESDIWVDEFLELVNEYKPLMWAEERGQIMSTLDPYIRKMFQNPKQRYVMREQFTSSAEKTARARSFQAYMSSGHVYFLKAEWTDDLMKELRSFPSGRHDDQVDALALIGRMLNEMVKKVEKTPKKAQDGYESGKLILPGLSDSISANTGSYRKI